MHSNYDRLVPLYERRHARFLCLAGGEAQCAIEGALSALLGPGVRLLDAGCGTGRLAGRILSAEPELDLTLLDASPRMLHIARRLPVRRVHGTLSALPFPDAQFDCVVAMWSLEASRCNVERVIAELARVLRPDGHLLLAHCAERSGVGVRGLLAKSVVRLRQAGRFLAPEVVANALRAQGMSRQFSLSCRGPVAALVAVKSARRTET